MIFTPKICLRIKRYIAFKITIYFNFFINFRININYNQYYGLRKSA